MKRRKPSPSGKRPGYSLRAPAPTREVLYGINPVEMALEAARRSLTRLWVKAGRPSEKLERLRKLASKRGVPVSEGDPARLGQIAGSPDHQGVALECGPLPTGDEAACLRGHAKEGALLVALDQVEDPRNFGAVVRSCALFGVAGLVLPRHHAAPLSPAASKASAGYMEVFPVFAVANLARFLARCRGHGFWVAGTREQGGTPLHRFRRDRPLVLVMGSEGRGLRPLIERECDLLLTVATPGAGSLNVSAAAAVILYHLTLPG